MSDPFQKALDKIAFHESQIVHLKRWINDGDTMLGNEPRFGDLASDQSVSVSVSVTRAANGKRWEAGDFFNKPLATATRLIMEARFEAAGGTASPASIDEIHEALSQGSFDFGTSGAEAQKNSIRISLGKNSVTFVRLPNSDKFGLIEWYGARARSRGRSRLSSDQSDQGDSASATADAEGQEEAAVSPAVPAMPVNGGSV